METQGQCLQFRRTLIGVLLNDWHQVLHIISTTTLPQGLDHFQWHWDTKGVFTVRSLYLFLNFHGVQPIQLLLWWQLPVPPKIRAFMWLMSKNKILTKLQLQDRGWQGDLRCQFCPLEESSDHLFFQCFFARAIWFYMGDCQHFRHHWTTLQDVIVFSHTLPKISRNAFLIVVCAVIWSVWKQRNDLCFSNSIVHSCRKTIMHIISLVVSWTGTLGEDMQAAVNAWLPQDMDVVPIHIVQRDDDRMLSWISSDSD